MDWFQGPLSRRPPCDMDVVNTSRSRSADCRLPGTEDDEALRESFFFPLGSSGMVSAICETATLDVMGNNTFGDELQPGFFFSDDCLRITYNTTIRAMNW